MVKRRKYDLFTPNLTMKDLLSLKCGLWNTVCKAAFLQSSFDCPRVVQNISSVCEYCRCSAADTMVPTRAEIVDSVAGHGRNLQTFEQCLRIVPCVYNV